MITKGHVTRTPQNDSQPLLWMVVGRSVLKKSDRTNGVLNECHVMKSSPRSPVWPSHHRIGHEKEWGQMEKKKKMPRNEEGYRTE